MPVPVATLTLATDTPDTSAVVRTGVAVGDIFYFGVSPFPTNQGGRDTAELWKSDGTADGTSRVSLLSLATTDYSPNQPPVLSNFTRSADRFFFTEYERDATHLGLWVSDGTTAGTVRLKTIDLSASMMSTYGAKGLRLTDVDGTLCFFTPNSSGTSWTRWTSDGTVAGTSQMGTTSTAAAVTSALSFGGSLYYVASGLWRTGATTSQAVQLSADSSVTAPVAVDDHLFYTTGSGASTTLWKSDGTTAGTSAFINSNTAAGTGPDGFGNLTAFQRRLYFTARTNVAGTELWNSDATTANPSQIADIRAGVGDASISLLKATDNSLFFRATDNASGSELWKTDGTTGGTVRVADIVSGTASSTPMNLTAIGSDVFFSVLTPDAGRELWRSDGTTAGTVSLGDLYPGVGGVTPTDLTPVGDSIFFRGSDAGFGWSQFVATQEPGSEVRVKDLIDGKPSIATSISHAATADGRMFYVDGSAGPTGAELYVADGQDGGQLVRDIYVGTNSSAPTEITAFGNQVYFAATNNTPGQQTGRELWMSDGTAAGTSLVKDIYFVPGSPTLSSDPYVFFRSGNYVFFTVYTGPANPDLNGLYRSDGTAAGTVKVSSAANLNQAPVPYRGKFYDGPPNYLSAMDGTTGAYSTVQVINSSYDSSQRWLGVANDELWFAGGSGYGAGTYGLELWKSDGTTSGTVLVKDIAPTNGFDRPNSSTPREFVGVGGLTLFTADDSIHGRELWRTDGTATGTMMVRDLTPGALTTPMISIGSLPSGLFASNGYVFLNETDGLGGVSSLYGAELWRTDGTADGTVLVKDINAGSASSSPGSRISFGGLLYFTADDGVHGRELWRTDGTEAGTQMVADLAPGADGSAPANLTVVGNKLWFTASDGTHGSQWFTLADDVAPALARSNYNAEGVGQTPSVTLRFSEPLTKTLTAGDLTLIERSTGLPVSNIGLSVNASSDAATITFTGIPQGVLPDGRYRLQIPVGAMSDAAGNFATGTANFDFFVLAGDANHDATVDFNDLLLIAKNYGGTAKTFSQGNFDYSADGKVTFDDLLILARNYNKSLLPVADIAEIAASPQTKVRRRSNAQLIEI